MHSKGNCHSCKFDGINFPRVTYGALHYRDLENDNCSKGPQMGLSEICFTFRPGRKRFALVGLKCCNIIGAISHEKPSPVFASKTGWSAVHDDSHTGSQWTHTESEAHINYLELITAYFDVTLWLRKYGLGQEREFFCSVVLIYQEN